MLELPTLSLFFRKCSLYRNNFKDSLKVFVYTNIATNVPLNVIFALFSGFVHSSFDSNVIAVVLEIFVMAMEGLVYRMFFKCGKVRCYTASVVANIVSSGLGILIVYLAD